MTVFTEIGSGGIKSAGRSVVYYKKKVTVIHNGYGRAMKNSNILKTIEETKNQKTVISTPIASVTPTYPADSFRIQHSATYCYIGENCGDAVIPKIVGDRQGQYMPPR